MNILLLEPYYGGSHRSFIRGLESHLACRFAKLTLPARKWKMRMQLAAPWMAEKTVELIQSGENFDCILCFSLLDAATYRTLLYQSGIDLPLGIYFHENQFAYPSRISDPQYHQFTALNFTSALAADALAFNSSFNRDSFLAGVTRYLKKAADMDILHLVETLGRKASVLYPGMDYTGMERPEQDVAGQPPVIVWNHRWEHDKDPQTFFHALFDLVESGIDFRLIVLGQQFARCPQIFDRARIQLAPFIDHFGYAGSRRDYIDLLSRGTIAVSTAKHEFFGIAMLEAVRCGCRPLVPDRLSYRELFPDPHRYREGDFTGALRKAVLEHHQPDTGEIDAMTESYSWPRLASTYSQWFSSLTQRKRSATRAVPQENNQEKKIGSW